MAEKPRPELWGTSEKCSHGFLNAKFFGLRGGNASAPRNLQDFRERCAPWGTKDAAHGASDNELVIRRGLEPREPSRTPLDRSCLLSPSCPHVGLFGFFFRFRVERGQQLGLLLLVVRVGIFARDSRCFALQRGAGMRGRMDFLQLADGHVRVNFRAG